MERRKAVPSPERHVSALWRRCFLFFIVIMAAMSTTFALSKEAETCLACHSDKSVAPLVDLAKMDASMHGSLDCLTCHAGASDLPHNAKTIKADCATCHSAEQAVYAKSVHGRAMATGDKAAAACVSCHGSGHAILAAKNPDSTVYHKNLPATCGTCHSAGKIPNAANANVNTAFDLYADSIHGKAAMKSGLLGAANCFDCHGSHDIQPKTDPTSPAFRGNISATCGKCHVSILRDYNGSSHAVAFQKGNEKAPVCSDCHIAHSIKRVDDSKAYNSLIDECGTCHAKEFETYRESFHGKIVYLGNLKVAKCSDCHNAHMVLPTSDPRSPTSSAQVKQTCQKCHTDANASFAQYETHAEYKDAKKNPLLFGIWLFMTALLVGVFAFFGVHTLLWFSHSIRTGKGRKASKTKEGNDAR